MKRRGVWIAVAVVLVAVAAAGVFAFLQARQFESLARAGKADASAALKSLQANDASAALASFQKAQDEFGRARDLLGPEWLRGVPWLGRQLAAADDLATIGREGSAAGAHAAQLLVDAGSVTGNDRLSRLLTLARPHLDAALASLVVVAQREDGLSTDGLVPQLADAVTQVRGVMEPLRPVLDRSQSLLDLERHLFSADHSFLLVAQNSSELRPTGGFMGTFGLLRFGTGGFALEKFADVYTLPEHDTLDLSVPPGGWIEPHHLYFRNSNWSIDFPSSAKSMLALWQNLGQPQVDGVVAIDIPVLQALLKVHGPITVPESSKVFTATTVMEQLNEVVQYDLSGQGDRSKRKLAVVSLVGELFRWLTSLPPRQAVPILNALVRVADDKHVQVFLTDPAAEAALVTVGWSGALAVPEDATDLLAVCNALIMPSKANIGVEKTLDYQVRLAADGSADTTLTLGFHKSPKLYKGVPQQWAAISTRVHRLAGTQLASGGSFTSMRDGIGVPTFGHYLRLDPGASKTVVLHSSLPAALRADSDGTRSYHLLLAKQADLSDTAATVTLIAPDGWRFVDPTASLRVSGKPVPTSGNGTTLTLRTPLAEDLLLDVVLARA